MILIERPGPLTTVQDLGRAGWAALGVSPSGAADRGALRNANSLVGNPDGAAALEVTLGGLVLRAERPILIAVTGAECPLTVDDVAVSPATALSLGTGSQLSLGNATRGLRAYVAIRGGIDVPPVLGSRSTDTLAKLGPPPLRAGDHLPLGAFTVAPAPPTSSPRSDHAASVAASSVHPALRVVPGPRADWFAPAALDELHTHEWLVTPAADRVGLRLDGPALNRVVSAELPSEGLVRGAIQVPADGKPVLLLADHPVTGGYPVIAVVVDADIDLAAQLRPGETLRFVSRVHV